MMEVLLLKEGRKKGGGLSACVIGKIWYGGRNASHVKHIKSSLAIRAARGTTQPNCFLATKHRQIVDAHEG